MRQREAAQAQQRALGMAYGNLELQSPIIIEVRRNRFSSLNFLWIICNFLGGYDWHDQTGPIIGFFWKVC